MSTESQSRPSTLGAFFRGLAGGAFSGALMMGIITGLTIATGGTFIGWGALAMMVSATGLFGGLMGIKRVLFDAPHEAPASTTYVPVPVQGMSGPALAPTIGFDGAEQQAAPTKSWVAQTGRGTDTQSRIQEILNRGDLNDRDRASAILAAREAADGQQKSIA